MKWQDIVIAICQISFVVALLPSIFSDDKPALSSSISTALAVFVIAFCMATLNLWFAFATSLSVGLAWSVLAAQKVRERESNNKS